MNPFADLANLSDGEIALLPNAPERVLANARATFIFAAGYCQADVADYDVAGCGGVYVEPGAWPVDGRFDLGALGTAVDADAQDATGGAL